MVLVKPTWSESVKVHLLGTPPIELNQSLLWDSACPYKLYLASPRSCSAMIHSSKRDTSPITLGLSLAPSMPHWPQPGQTGERRLSNSIIYPKPINLVNFSIHTWILLLFPFTQARHLLYNLCGAKERCMCIHKEHVCQGSDMTDDRMISRWLCLTQDESQWRWASEAKRRVFHPSLSLREGKETQSLCSSRRVLLFIERTAKRSEEPRKHAQLNFTSLLSFSSFPLRVAIRLFLPELRWFESDWNKSNLCFSPGQP